MRRRVWSEHGIDYRQVLAPISISKDFPEVTFVVEFQLGMWLELTRVN